MNLKEKKIEGLFTRTSQFQFFSKCCIIKDSLIPVSVRLESKAQLIFSSCNKKLSLKLGEIFKQVPNSEIYSQSHFSLLITSDALILKIII